MDDRAEFVIRRATTACELLAASPLLDSPARPEWAGRFLAAPGHHLFLAYADGVREPVGFVSGIERFHPDKGVEMCLYELAVDEAYRRRGIGRALTKTPAALARELGCYDMWVGVEADNAPALAAYRAAGAGDDGGCRMPAWEFGG